LGPRRTGRLLRLQELGGSGPYPRPKGGAEVVLVIIEGGGHTWPGREPTPKLLGKSTKNISANDLKWDFFQKDPMK